MSLAPLRHETRQHVNDRQDDILQLTFRSLYVIHYINFKKFAENKKNEPKGHIFQENIFQEF